jgi:hypothetical protein
VRLLLDTLPRVVEAIETSDTSYSSRRFIPNMKLGPQRYARLSGELPPLAQPLGDPLRDVLRPIAALSPRAGHEGVELDRQLDVEARWSNSEGDILAAIRVRHSTAGLAHVKEG